MTETANDFTDLHAFLTDPAYLAQQAERTRLSRQAVVEHKAAIIAKAGLHHIARIEVSYDGEGDEGQIQEIVGYRHRLIGEEVDEDETALIVDLTVLGFVEGSSAALADDVDAFAWSVLDIEHSGFEINDGGSGTLVIDVETGTAKLTRNDNYMALETSEVEV